jgi:hypothetical protein
MRRISLGHRSPGQCAQHTASKPPPFGRLTHETCCTPSQAGVGVENWVPFTDAQVTWGSPEPDSK